jgi:hypothetical protein
MPTLPMAGRPAEASCGCGATPWHMHAHSCLECVHAVGHACTCECMWRGTGASVSIAWSWMRLFSLADHGGQRALASIASSIIISTGAEPAIQNSFMCPQ